MMNKITIKKVSLFLVVVSLTISLAACSFFTTKTEKEAVKAFGDLLNIYPAEDIEGYYQITALDGGAKFLYSNDIAGVSIDAAPFIFAGLNVEEVDNVFESMFYQTDLSFRLASWDMLNQNVKDSALAQFKANIRYFKIVETDDTYKINFPDDSNNRIGIASFEWVKILDSDGRTFIFTVKAEPLLAAGVDPDKVEGWDYIKSSDGDMSFQKVIYSGGK